MDDVRLGRSMRAVRHAKALRLCDLGEEVGLSISTLSRIEAGALDGLSLRTLRRAAEGLQLQIFVAVRSPGGGVDRLLDRAHAALGESVARWLVSEAWRVRPEVSFSRWGERGVIDLLAWHPQRRGLLVIELKTAIVDLQDLLGSLDRKVRLAPDIARDLGWESAWVAAAVIVTDDRTNRRRVHEHAALLRSALPSDGRRLRPWVSAPDGRIRALAFWPKLPVQGLKSGSRVLRVRR